MFRTALSLAIVSAASIGSLNLANALSPTRPTHFRGEAQAMGDGQAWTWVKTDSQGRPVSIGITLTESALGGLPTEGGHSCCDGPQWTLPLPKDASSGPVQHVVVNWNPQGHPPEGVYTVPHFDFHFYTISEAERLKIKDAPEADAHGTLPPPSEQLPEGYIQAPGVVGAMGCHWIDAKAPELNGVPFTATFLYGSYDGKVTFIEPMITRAVLESKVNRTLTVKAPAKPADDRFVPTRYRIEFDAAAKQITIAMDHVAE